MAKLTENAVNGINGTIVAVAIIVAVYKYKMARLGK